jgi:hypothetical protein
MPQPPKIVGADELARWNQYAAMLRDYHHDGPNKADGVLMRDELESYIDKQRREREGLVRKRESTLALDNRLRESYQMLSDMVAAGVDGLSYLPEDVEALDLPQHLVRRVSEMLMTDDRDSVGEITQEVLDRARVRYYDMPAILIRQRDVALAEIAEIAEKLGLH